MIKRIPLLVFVEMSDTEDEETVRSDVEYALRGMSSRDVQVFVTDATTDHIKKGPHDEVVSK